MSDSDEHVKQLLAHFIAARLKAKQDDAKAAQTARRGPEPTSSSKPDHVPAATHHDTIRRHDETPLPGRARYRLFGLGSSN